MRGDVPTAREVFNGVASKSEQKQKNRGDYGSIVCKRKTKNNDLVD